MQKTANDAASPESGRDLCVHPRRIGNEQLLNRRMVLECLGFSTATLYRLISKSQFPGAIAISPGRVAWRESEIMKWLETRRSPSSTNKKQN
jgi:predicted DNA-binding transcriptional regulator AlpA